MSTKSIKPKSYFSLVRVFFISLGGLFCNQMAYKVLEGWQCQILTLHIYHTPLVKARNILLGKAVKERSYGSDSWSRTRASLATALPPWTDYQVHFPDSLRCLLTIWREANNSHFGTLLNIPPIIFHHFPPYPNLNYVCRICQDS